MPIFLIIVFLDLSVEFDTVTRCSSATSKWGLAGFRFMPTSLFVIMFQLEKICFTLNMSFHCFTNDIYYSTTFLNHTETTRLQSSVNN